MSKNAVLVTGANGFLGLHLLESLNAHRQRPMALVRKTWSHGSVADSDVVQGSPMDPSTWVNDARLEPVHTIIHSAAMVRHSRTDADEMIRFNVDGTLGMVRAAKTLGARLVFISTSGVVGCFHHADQEADEDSPYCESVSGRWPYYASKIRAERAAIHLAEKLGVPLTIVRPPVLLGPGDVTLRASGHILRLLEGRLPVIPRGGMHFVDIRDAAAAVARLVGLESWSPTYHLPGTAMSLRRFYQMIGEVSGTPVQAPNIPNWLFRGLTSGINGTFRLLGRPAPRFCPDPVIVEMSSCFWGLRTLRSHRDLDFRTRSPRQTLIDAVHWLRTESPHREALVRRAKHR